MEATKTKATVSPIVHINIFDMQKTLNNIEITGWSLKGLFYLDIMLVFISDKFQFGGEYFWLWMASLLVIVTVFTTVWIMWAIVKNAYNRWLKNTPQDDITNYKQVYYMHPN